LVSNSIKNYLSIVYQRLIFVNRDKSLESRVRPITFNGLDIQEFGLIRPRFVLTATVLQWFGCNMIHPEFLECLNIVLTKLQKVPTRPPRHPPPRD
jgi:hypothetical protein